jgi:hypothetical protein
MLLAGRLGRQQDLSRPQPPAVTVVMAEAVLHRGVGGSAVMYEQLTHLADESRQPKVMIQVIPAEVSAHAGLGELRRSPTAKGNLLSSTWIRSQYRRRHGHPRSSPRYGRGQTCFVVKHSRVVPHMS